MAVAPWSATRPPPCMLRRPRPGRSGGPGDSPSSGFCPPPRSSTPSDASAFDDTEDSSSARESPMLWRAYALRITGVRAHNPHLNSGLSVAVKDQQRKEKQSQWTSRGVCGWAVVLRHRHDDTTPESYQEGCRNSRRIAPSDESWSSAHQLPRCQVRPGFRAGELDRGAG